MSVAARWTLRLSVTLGLFALLCWRIDLRQIGAEFHGVEPGWALAGLALTLPQVLISAWRWRLTAGAVGLALPLTTAVREYYLATFLNQLLPGGVLGDATRAWRHGRHQAQSSDAWHAVVIERISGQLSLALVATAAVLLAPDLRSGVRAALLRTDGLTPTLAASTGLLLVAALALALAGHAGLLEPARRFARHTGRALFGARTWGLQLLSSLLVVATYIGVFLCGARAIGAATPMSELWVLVTPVLMAMAIPLSIAGWDIREGAAALVWMLAGLPAHEGVALSLTYGTLVLISSLPGALMLARDRDGQQHALARDTGQTVP